MTELKQIKNSKSLEAYPTDRIQTRITLNGGYKKIHEAVASLRPAPLLNLNLNYEKLRSKYTIFFK